MTGIALAVGIIGVLLIALGTIPQTRRHVPYGINVGIALVIVAVVVYVILALVVPS